MTHAVQKQIYPPTLLPAPKSQKHEGPRLMPLGLFVLALLGGAAAETFGPASVRLAFRSIDLVSTRGLSAALIAFLAVVTMHEAGHLAAAICMRFKILGIALGPFRLTRLHCRWTCRFIARNLFTGSISAIPMDERLWRTRMLTVIASGPTVSLFTAVAALHLLLYVEPGSWLCLALSETALLNLAVFYLGLFPNGSHARSRNDAQFFWCVLRNTEEAQEIRLYQRLMRMKVQGVRPAEYPDQLFEELTCNFGRQDMCLVFADALMKCGIDRGDFEMADRWHTRAMQFIANANSPAYNVPLAESACFDLLFRQDTRSAQAKFFMVRLAEISPDSLRHRLTAAARLAEGNTSAAVDEVGKALSCLPPNSYSRFERLLMARLAAHHAH
jgi:hypothetical protein